MTVEESALKQAGFLVGFIGERPEQISLERENERVMSPSILSFLPAEQVDSFVAAVDRLSGRLESLLGNNDPEAQVQLDPRACAGYGDREGQRCDLEIGVLTWRAGRGLLFRGSRSSNRTHKVADDGGSIVSPNDKA